MNEDRLSEYVSRSQSLIDSSPQMDEQNTRRKIIEPFIDEVLGWDILSSDVELEYSVPMGSGTKKVDYALMLEGTPMVFVEAKGVDSSIGESERDQLKSYLRQTGVDWGLLTNGKNFEVMKRRTKGTRPDEIAFGPFTLDGLENNIQIFRTLSKSSIDSGESTKIAETIETSHQAATTIRKQKEQLSERISGILVEEIDDSLSQRMNELSKQFLDSVANTLEDQNQNVISIDTGGEVGQNRTDIGGWTPRPGANAIVGSIERSQIEGEDETPVAVFPTRESGIKFLKENNAWGFVQVKQNPEIAAFYVAGGPSEVQYVARIADIVPATEATLAHDAETYTGEEAGFDPNDQIVVFEPGTLFELEDPIPYESKAPQSRVYTDLKSLRTAETTKELY